MEQQSAEDLEREYKEYRFQRLECVSENVWIVWDRETGSLCRYCNITENQHKIYLCLSKISDCHLPRILMVGSDFIVEEYIHGMDLKEKMNQGTEDGSKENGKDGKYFSRKEVKKLLKQLLPTIQKLHQHGIIHRDIKASNVMVNEYGVYYLVDFDIAIQKSAHDEETEKEAAGTVGYASPEQYGYGECDARSDIYSLGVLINVLLTGQVPKKKVPAGQMGRVIKKCVCLDRKDRYQSVEELYHAVFGSRKRTVCRVLLLFLCLVLGISGIVSAVEKKKAKVQTAAQTEDENYHWEELKNYNISYPCLWGMQTLEPDLVEKKELQEIDEKLMERQMEYEEELEKKIYYRTEDGAEFVLSVLRDIRLKTGYEILQEELEYCGDRFAYNDASNTSFCYGEQYGEDKAFYCAGVARNGIWLYMEMLCPKSYEKSYKEYIEFWKNSVKDLGNIPGWQEKWERYGEGKYSLNQS